MITFAILRAQLADQVGRSPAGPPFCKSEGCMAGVGAKGQKCFDCLVAELAEIVPPELARRYAAALCEVRWCEGRIRALLSDGERLP